MCKNNTGGQSCVGWTKAVGVEREPLSSPTYDKAILGHVTLWGTEGPKAWVTVRPGPPRVRVLTTGKVVHAQDRVE